MMTGSDRRNFLISSARFAVLFGIGFTLTWLFRRDKISVQPTSGCPAQTACSSCRHLNDCDQQAAAEQRVQKSGTDD